MPQNSDVRIGIIGGSGLDDVLFDGMKLRATESHDIDTPFGKPSAPIITADVGELSIALLKRHGDGHVYNPGAVPYRANIYALKALGCTHLIATGAAGSLREQIHPGELVVCDQIIDRTHGRARTLFDHAAVHVEFAEPFCPVMRLWLLQAAASLRTMTVHDRGCYLCMEGPAFSTRAESHMHQQWGADVVGMTAMPEAKLAREAEMAYALIAMPTDYDCWKPRDPDESAASLLEEIISNLKRATAAAMKLIQTSLSDTSALRNNPSPAHDALKLAIWSDKSAIDKAEIERLRGLWGRYFS